MRVLLETENAIVSYDEQKKALVVIWSGSGGEDEFHLVYNNVIKGFKIFFAQTLMLDLEKFGKLGDLHLNHLLKDIFPMAVKCGLRKLVLVSMDANDKKSIREAIERLPTAFFGKMDIQYSLNFDNAFSNLSA